MEAQPIMLEKYFMTGLIRRQQQGTLSATDRTNFGRKIPAIFLFGCELFSYQIIKTDVDPCAAK